MLLIQLERWCTAVYHCFKIQLELEEQLYLCDIQWIFMQCRILEVLIVSAGINNSYYVLMVLNVEGAAFVLLSLQKQVAADSLGPYYLQYMNPEFISTFAYLWFQKRVVAFCNAADNFECCKFLHP